MNLVKKYENQNSEYNYLFNEWIGIEKLGLKFLLDQFKNRNYFLETSPGEFIFKGWSTLHNQNNLSEINSTDLNYEINNTLITNFNKEKIKYITIGKGYH